MIVLKLNFEDQSGVSTVFTVRVVIRYVIPKRTDGSMMNTQPIIFSKGKECKGRNRPFPSVTYANGSR